PKAGPSIFDLTFEQNNIERHGYDYVDKYKQYTISFNFNDTQGQPNYYRISGYIDRKTEWQDQRMDIVNYDYDLFNDAGKDGTLIRIPNFEIYRSYYYDDLKEEEEISGQLFLLSSDKHYYEYHRTVKESYNNENPFAEPILMYTNIKGGLGVFSAFNRSSIYFEL
ncbi:MAG: DUF4249 domain-containing protein, partial [Bacteroidota bacterium]|nr:DUF4249 domain-containing protein [Bacteroidota bacterium]